jgi:hypothetical protein
VSRLRRTGTEYPTIKKGIIPVQAHNAPSPPPPTRPEDLPGEEPAPPIETPLTPEPGNPPLDPNPEHDNPNNLDPDHAP